MSVHLSKRFKFSLALIVMLTLLLAVTTQRALRASRADAEWVAHTAEVLAAVGVIRAATNEADNAWRVYILSGSDIGDVAQARQKVSLNVEHVTVLTRHNTAQSGNLHRLDELLSEHYKTQNLILERRAREGFIAAVTLVRSNPDAALSLDVQAQLDVIRNAEISLLTTRVGQSKTTSRRLSLLCWALFVLVCVLILYSARTVICDLKRRQEIARHLAKTNAELRRLQLKSFAGDEERTASLVELQQAITDASELLRAS